MNNEQIQGSKVTPTLQLKIGHLPLVIENCELVIENWSLIICPLFYPKNQAL